MATVSEPTRSGAPAAEAATGQSGLARPRNFVERNHFWLRRLHSLTGVLPIGGFLIYHFWENATALQAPDHFDTMATHARDIQLLFILEYGIILLPLIYHALYGLFIASYTRINVGAYSYARNRLFMWQRVTGILTMLYITYHVLVLRFGAFSEVSASYATMTQHLQNPLVFAFYTVGILAASYHLGNGLWAFLITWGITIGKRAQRISQWVTTGVSVGMSVLGMAIIITFVVRGGGFRF
ncbi:MAG: succinate dehydrogenase [Chloroflexota bacterium]|nr:succinate dehydrogenase [Chloroflexota bacterium]